jgi:hypothetical protein
MTDNEDPTETYIKEVEDWVNSARRQIRMHSLEKGLIYSYDFSHDRPINNTYSRLIWEIPSMISPKSLHKRSSSASQNRNSSLSTAVALDFDIPDLTFPSAIPDLIEINDQPDPDQRTSAPFCLRKRLGSEQFNNFIFKSFSRSKSF